LHWVGPIPDGQLIRHTCDNPPCCNPAHLLNGTTADNMRDMVRRRRHGGEKLTPDDVRRIRDEPVKRGSVKALAAEYGVHPQTITEIRAGRSRSDVAGPPSVKRTPLHERDACLHGHPFPASLVRVGGRWRCRPCQQEAMRLHKRR
jgi:hypothetical protein